MKPILLIFLINIHVICFGQSYSSTVNANNTFTFELFKELFDSNDNLFLSPYSISSALAMTYAGARSETEKQMKEVLHFDSVQARTHEGFSMINQSFNKSKSDTSFKLSVANALWREKNTPLKPGFLNLINNYYKAAIYPITNAKAINDWAEKETNKKIKNLVNDETISDANLVLTNAVYFKANWETSFDSKNTIRDTFFTNDNKKVLTPLMYQSKEVSYFEDDDKQVIELPYRGSFSMIIFLPKTNKTLADLVNKTDNISLQKISNKLMIRKVHILFPKFNIQSAFSLGNTLQNMGMTNAFSQDAADFSGMGDRFFISEVVHKSLIEVNEKGTEAAAATAVIMMQVSAFKDEDITFNANKPFLFLIKDNQTKSILFIGSMLNPQQKGK